jgi:hypothetical protein
VASITIDALDIGYSWCTLRFILDPSLPNLGITPINVTTRITSTSDGTMDIVVPDNISINGSSGCAALPLGDYTLINTVSLYVLPNTHTHMDAIITF